MKTFLKCKIKHLATEPVIIRHEKHRWLKAASRLTDPAKRDRAKLMANSVHEHCVHIVRPEARASQLAYAFLRNRPYADVEPRRYSDPNWERILTLAIGFGKRYFAWNEDYLKQAFAEWRLAAPEILQRQRKTKSDSPRVHRTLEEYKKNQESWDTACEKICYGPRRSAQIRTDIKV